jgi:DNA-binding YbaB/EbfC family protein
MSTAAKTNTNGINGIVKQAQKMQQQISRVQDQMNEKEIEATSGGGAVLAAVNGKQEVVRLEISAELLKSEDATTVSELVMAAVNLAMENSREMIQSEVNRITGGLNIPGLF